eukprot:scaffold29045_cov55-Phaeocystis_antarctica.AAC.1
MLQRHRSPAALSCCRCCRPAATKGVINLGGACLQAVEGRVRTEVCESSVCDRAEECEDRPGPLPDPRTPGLTGVAQQV